ncbi:MAG: hypothetical protein DI539_28810, partial [Flavobacterium psychrophilum]
MDTQLRSNRVLVLYANISRIQKEDWQNDVFQELPTDFQQRILSYKNTKDVRASLLGKFLLKKGLELFKEEAHLTTLQQSKFGKPFREGSSTRFNISHSGDLVVCALANKMEIGIDIELISSMTSTTHNQLISFLEKKQVLKIPSVSFWKYWTQKEAVVKAHGSGLSSLFTSFNINNGKTTLHNTLFYLYDLPVNPNYACSLATSENE